MLTNAMSMKSCEDIHTIRTYRVITDGDLPREQVIEKKQFDDRGEVL